MEWAPTGKVEVVKVAKPPLMVTGAEPATGVVPSRNVTVPVAEGGVTLAVRVTACPAVEGLAEDATVRTAAILLTTCVKG